MGRYQLWLIVVPCPRSLPGQVGWRTPAVKMGDISDPLRSLELEDTEDIFKTEFKGSVGR